MPLTPIDVQQKTFGTALRGYDLDEVDDFLDEVVTSLKDYEQRLRDAQDRISTLESEMSDRGDAEGAISRALVAAQRSADGIVDEAKVEAEQVLADARAQAEEIGIEHETELANARAEVDRLRGSVADMRRQVRTLTSDLDSTLDQMDSAVAEGEARFTSDSLSTEDQADELAEDQTDEGSLDVDDASEHGEAMGAHEEQNEDSFTSVPESSPLDRLPSIEDLEAEVRPEVDAIEQDAELAVTSESDDTYDPTYDTSERSVRPWEK